MQMFVIFLWQLWISREQFDCRQDKNMPFHIVAKCTVHQKRVWLERCERKLKYTSYRKMHEETHLASELHSVCFSPNQVWSKVYTEQKTISACSLPLWELYYDSAEFSPVKYSSRWRERRQITEGFEPTDWKICSFFVSLKPLNWLIFIPAVWNIDFPTPPQEKILRG